MTPSVSADYSQAVLGKSHPQQNMAVLSGQVKISFVHILAYSCTVHELLQFIIMSEERSS